MCYEDYYKYSLNKPQALCQTYLSAKYDGFNCPFNTHYLHLQLALNTITLLAL